ncbi:MAG TPA: SRPBCC domain-containing protein [Planctomycetota bacterium]|nr:SRPBCC domain-containing protein [Planctomycetota bacterium]
MHDLLHQIEIDAPPLRVFDALTRQEELRRWWNAGSLVEPRRGSVAELGFCGRTASFRTSVDELEAPARLEWTCLGDDSEWAGTRLVWSLVPTHRGATELRLRHEGWRSTDGSFAACNSTWGALMFRLKDHLEGREPGPLFEC